MKHTSFLDISLAHIKENPHADHIKEHQHTHTHIPKTLKFKGKNISNEIFHASFIYIHYVTCDLLLKATFEQFFFLRYNSLVWGFIYLFLFFLYYCIFFFYLCYFVFLKNRLESTYDNIFVRILLISIKISSSPSSPLEICIRFLLHYLISHGIRIYLITNTNIKYVTSISMIKTKLNQSHKYIPEQI